MTPEEIDHIIELSRQQRLESLGRKLLSGMDRSEDAVNRLRWELEEELNESLYVSLDLMGWSGELLRADFAEIKLDLDWLLQWFEVREEYEACRTVTEAQAWLQGKIDFFLQEIAKGEEPAHLIGL